MALAYIPPGVSVEEIFSPSVSPLLSVPTSVCIVGLTQGSVTRTDLIELSGATPVAIPNLPTGATLDDVSSVSDSVDPGSAPNDDGTYRLTNDYTVSISAGTITRVPPSTTTTVSSTLSTAAAVGNTTITVGSATGFVIGQTVTIDTGPNEETRDITNIAGNVLTLTTPALIDAHAIGTVVSSSTTLVTGDGLIPDGRIVAVTYDYTPQDYFEPIRLSDQGSILSRFGPAIDANNNIVSDLSFAASLALANGASTIVCQPLYSRTVQGDPTTPKRQPTIASASTAGSAANPSTWEDTLFGLRDLEDVNVIVPLIGQSMSNVDDAAWLQVAQKAQAHVEFMKNQQQYIFLLLGEDSSADVDYAKDSTINSHALTLGSLYGGDTRELMALVNTSKFTYPAPSSAGSQIFIGGQYFMAGLAGVIAGQPIQTPVTRKTVGAITGVADYRSLADKNADAANGLLVAEQKGNLVQVRHGITLDNTSTARREISISRAKYYMLESLIDTIDNQIIGQVVADGNSPLVVRSAVIGVLEQIKGDGVIVAYGNIDVRMLTLDPTTIEVRFSYSPSFPINYIDIIFSIDLSSASITGTTTDGLSTTAGS